MGGCCCRDKKPTVSAEVASTSERSRREYALNLAVEACRGTDRDPVRLAQRIDEFLDGAASSATSGGVCKVAGDVPVGSQTVRIKHGLGTTDVVVSIYDKKNGSVYTPEITIEDENTVRVVLNLPNDRPMRWVVVG